MTGNENWDFLYAYMYLRFWPSNVPMISDLNITVSREEDYLVDQKKTYSLETHSMHLDVPRSAVTLCYFVTL